MNDPSNSVLVLGSAGFAGAVACARLAADGFHVHAFGRSERVNTSPGITHIRGSIEDRDLLRESLVRCRYVVYAASMTTPGASARDPALEVIGNLLPLARLLECAGDIAGRRVIYLSSGGTVYGDLAEGATEGNVLRPRSYYGAGKAAAEAMIHACVATTDWTATCLRPTNLYGPGQRVTKGFAIIPTLFDRAIDGGTFTVWGDGSIVRDYCHVEDLAGAIIAALANDDGARFTIYNVASGEVASVNQLIAACERASGRRIEVEYQPARDVDVAHVSPSNELIHEALGWSPSFGLAQGLRQTWEWRMAAGDDKHNGATRAATAS